MKITNIHVHLIFFSLTLFFITNIIVANRKTNYSDLRTVSLNKTNCSYLINRTHLIVLSVVLRQQRGYLFLHTFSYFHSWDLQLSSWFLFRSEFFFRTTQELEYFFLSRKVRNCFQEFNIRLYDKNSESDYFFSLHQNQNICFSNIGNQNIFSEKNHNPPPPLQVKWSFPYRGNSVSFLTFPTIFHYISWACFFNPQSGIACFPSRNTLNNGV